jgi:hypothetical protein
MKEIKWGSKPIPCRVYPYPKDNPYLTSFRDMDVIPPVTKYFEDSVYEMCLKVNEGVQILAQSKRDAKNLCAKQLFKY